MSWAVFEKKKKKNSEGVILVIQKLTSPKWHFTISLLLVKIFSSNLDKIFSIKPIEPSWVTVTNFWSITYTE